MNASDRPAAPVGGGTMPLSMPKQCQTGKTSPEAMGWRLSATKPVRVYYLKDNFNRAEVEALTRGVNNWNRALLEIASPVIFVNSGEREAVVRDELTITVMRGVPKSKERVGEIKFYTKPNGSVRMTVIMSPTVTDLNALTSLITHELGHAMGLADCYGCKRGTTAMSAFKGRNKGNDVYEPSACDKYVVATGYAGANNSQPLTASLEEK
ncbi:MAG TPA: M57 family metalloprotease [Pyrinomonadaceae bacterium]|nr:M57 family metalloprotease [Pyrinomonadaceae bacterium]